MVKTPRILKQLGLGALGLASLLQTTKADGTLTGRLQTPTGDAPYSVEAFEASLQRADGQANYQVFFNEDGTFHIPGIVNSVKENEIPDVDTFADIGGADAAANINGLLPTGLNKSRMKARLFNILGQELRTGTEQFDYDASTGKTEFYANMSGLSNGVYLATIDDGTGQAHTTKFVHNNAGQNGRISTSVQSLEQMVESNLKSASILPASNSGTAYSLIVNDPFDNLRDSTYTDIIITNNEVTTINPVMKHNKKADVEFEVVRDGETIYTPIVISRGEDRDTIRTTNASLDLDRFGYEVMFEVPDLGETLPFEGMSQSDNLRPGMNEKKSFTVVPIIQVPTGSVSGMIRTPTQEVPFGVMQYVGELEAVDDPTYTHQVSFTNQGEFSLENVTTTLDEMVGREFVLRVSDPNQNLKDTTYTDINVYNNQNTELQKQMKHNKKAEFAFVVRDSNLQRINDVPVVFSNEIDGVLQTDTTWIDDPASGIGQASLDLDKLGYSPLASMEYVDDVSTRPFKPHQEVMNLQPGNNPNKTFNVELYNNQKLILQLINPIDTTQVIPNNQVRIRYVNDNLRQEIYYTNEQGIVELERRPKNDVIAIGIAGNETYFGRSGMEGTELKYQLVKNENMEERVQKIALVPKTLPTGNPENPTVEINSFEWNQAYAGVSLQAANKEMNIHFNHPYITTEKFQEYLDYFSEQMGITYQMVPTNKDPGAVPDYNYYTNNYKHGNDEVFTNSFSQGDPRTINQIAEFDGKLVLRSTIATSPSVQDDVFKEIWRMAGLDGTGYGNVSSAGGGTEFNDKERAVARMKIEMDHLYVKGTDYAPAKNIVTE